jgi:hypothetical protein
VGRRTAVASFVLDIVSKRRRLAVVGDCQRRDVSQVLGSASQKLRLKVDKVSYR